MIVLPLAGVDSATAQADEDGNVLNADRALEFACAAGGALESSFLRVVFAEQRLIGLGTEVIQVVAKSENDFLGVEQLSGVGSGAMLRAAAALHAGIRLKADQLRKVSASDEAEVFITGERRNLREAASGEKDGDWAEQQVQVLGVRNDGQEGEQGEGVHPPEHADGRSRTGDEERGQIGGHQHKDEQGDEARFPGEMLPEPFGPDEKAADKKREDADCTGQRKNRSKPEVETAENARRIEKAKTENGGAVIEGNKGEGEEGPEDKGMSEAGKRSLPDDLGLQEDFPDEVADARSNGEEVETGVFF